ncbi:glycosyltransferase family 2 protein [Lactobacillus sp. AN1001]
MTDELVSIIIPVYNVQKYVELCIKSCINQTYENIEIILVDDGSTDSSGKICDEYSKRDNRISVIHTTNRGQGSARNIGLNKCTGDFITFLDADDVLNENFIQILQKLLINYNADIVAYAWC